MQRKDCEFRWILYVYKRNKMTTSSLLPNPSSTERDLVRLPLSVSLLSLNPEIQGIFSKESSMIILRRKSYTYIFLGRIKHETSKVSLSDPSCKWEVFKRFIPYSKIRNFFKNKGVRTVEGGVYYVH